MNAMNCPQVQEQLDLLAADACDPPTRQALEDHLKQCPQCTGRYQESQRLFALLDLHWNQDALERLHERIEQQARRSHRRIFTPFVRRMTAAAAVLLIALGVIWWFPKKDADQPGVEPEFALLVRADEQNLLVPMAKDAATPLNEKKLEVVVVQTRAELKGEAFRKNLIQAQRDGKLPEPPLVPLALTLVNTGKRPVQVHLGDRATELTLDLQGDGVVRMPAGEAAEAMFLKPQSFQLNPGEQHVLHIDRLIAGSLGRLEYVYLTEPGEYTLTPRLRLTADNRAVTVTGETVRIKVGN
jgi:Putative zinc-finger